VAPIGNGRPSTGRPAGSFVDDALVARSRLSWHLDGILEMTREQLAQPGPLALRVEPGQRRTDISACSIWLCDPLRAYRRVQIDPGADGRQPTRPRLSPVGLPDGNGPSSSNPFTFVVMLDGVLRLAPRRSEHVARHDVLAAES
jgi:hypothetical protein